MPGSLTLEWFGCTTFRLRVDGLTIWLDTFLDRVAAAPQVGLTAAEVDEADYIFVSHSHFDHILGANVVALRTGAPVVGSYESDTADERGRRATGPAVAGLRRGGRRLRPRGDRGGLSRPPLVPLRRQRPRLRRLLCG